MPNAAPGNLPSQTPRENDLLAGILAYPPGTPHEDLAALTALVMLDSPQDGLRLAQALRLEPKMSERAAGLWLDIGGHWAHPRLADELLPSLDAFGPEFRQKLRVVTLTGTSLDMQVAAQREARYLSGWARKQDAAIREYYGKIAKTRKTAPVEARPAHDPDLDLLRSHFDELELARKETYWPWPVVETLLMDHYGVPRGKMGPESKAAKQLLEPLRVDSRKFGAALDAVTLKSPASRDDVYKLAQAYAVLGSATAGHNPETKAEELMAEMGRHRYKVLDIVHQERKKMLEERWKKKALEAAREKDPSVKIELDEKTGKYELMVDGAAEGGPFVEHILEEDVSVGFLYDKKFSEGLLRVENKNDKVGFIDTEGKMAIPHAFNYAGDFSEGLAVVRIGDKFGYVDRTGKMVIPCTYGSAYDFQEGLAQVISLNSNGTKEFINKNGETVFESDLICRRDNGFSNGVAIIHGFDDAYCKLIDAKGRLITDKAYANAGNRAEGMIAVSLRDGRDGAEKWGFVDTKGKQVVPCEYDRVSEYSDGLACVMREDDASYVNKAGKTVIGPIKGATEATRFRDGLAAIRKNGKNFYIKKDGNVAFQARYEMAGEFSDGRAQVRKNGLWGYIDTFGTEVIPCRFDWVSSFSEGFARVDIGHLNGVIDHHGNTVIPCEYESMLDFANGATWARRKDGKSVILRLVDTARFQAAQESAAPALSILNAVHADELAENGLAVEMLRKLETEQALEGGRSHERLIYGGHTGDAIGAEHRPLLTAAVNDAIAAGKLRVPACPVPNNLVRHVAQEFARMANVEIEPSVAEKALETAKKFASRIGGILEGAGAGLMGMFQGGAKDLLQAACAPKDSADMVGGDPEKQHASDILKVSPRQRGMFVTDWYGAHKDGAWHKSEFSRSTPPAEGKIVRMECEIGAQPGETAVLPCPPDASVEKGSVRFIGADGREKSGEFRENHLGEATVEAPSDAVACRYSLTRGSVPPVPEALGENDYAKFRESFVGDNGNDLARPFMTLPRDLLTKCDRLRGLPPLERAMGVQEAVRSLFSYDFKHAQVKEEKKDLSPEETLAICARRAAQNGGIENGKPYAGVCTDCAQVAAAMLRRCGLLAGTATGFSVDGATADAGHAHACAYFLWPDGRGDAAAFLVDGTPDGGRGQIASVHKAQEEHAQAAVAVVEELSAQLEEMAQKGAESKKDESGWHRALETPEGREKLLALARTLPKEAVNTAGAAMDWWLYGKAENPQARHDEAVRLADAHPQWARHADEFPDLVLLFTEYARRFSDKFGASAAQELRAAVTAAADGLSQRDRNVRLTALEYVLGRATGRG